MKKNLVPFPQTAASQQMIQFGGVNYSQGAAAGELADSHNMSTREFPCLSQRRGREKVGEYSAGTSIFVHNKLIVVDGATLKCDGAVVGNVQPGEKEFAVVNTKLCIWPDKKYLDLTNMEFGALDYAAKSAPGTETSFDRDTVKLRSDYGTAQNGPYYQALTPHFEKTGQGYVIKTYKSVSWDNGWVLEGEEICWVPVGPINNIYSPPEEHRNLEEGDIVLLQVSKVDGAYELIVDEWKTTRDADGTERYWEGDFSEEPNDEGFYAVVKKWDWEAIHEITPNYAFTNSYITFDVFNAKYPAVDFRKKFKIGDMVQISGCVQYANNNTSQDAFLTIKDVQESALSFADTSFSIGRVTDEITIQRILPPITHICSHHNRLWGVEGGERIWGSVLGDPTKFYLHEGVSTDSYSVAVGSDGAFTGCCSYGTEVLFFKEDKLYKLYGTAPDNYELYENTMRGVMEGSHKSLTVLNETLFFHSREGVCVYTGGVPSLISSGFGLRRFRNAVGGTDGERYYIAMEDEKDGSGGVWVFDPNTGLWQQEDKERAVGFCYMDGDFYILSGAGVLTKERSDSFEAEGVWSATFAPMTEMVHERKCYSTILLRYTPHEGSVLKVEVSTDGGAFCEVAIRKHDAKAGTAVLPIRPNRCDKFQIRLSGTGYCRIESMVRKVRAGGLW